MNTRKPALKLTRKEKKARETAELLASYPPELLEEIAEAAKRIRARKAASRTLARSLRSVILAHHEQRCYACRERHGSIMEIHHIDPVHELGSFDPANLVPLCPNCHAYAHALRRSRNNEAGWEALRFQILDAHEGWFRVFEVLENIATAESTLERMREEIKARSS